MTEERALAILRAAERLGRNALGWMPYTDEVPEAQLSALTADLNSVQRDLDFIRDVKREVEDAILNVAEHKGSKR
jgi:hypothetical protein